MSKNNQKTKNQGLANYVRKRFAMHPCMEQPDERDEMIEELAKELGIEPEDMAAFVESQKNAGARGR